MKRSLLGAGLCLLLAVVLWQRGQGGQPPVQREIFALGTLVQFTVPQGAGLSVAQIDSAIGQAVAALESIHREWSPRGQGALGRLNADLATSAQAALPAILRKDLLRGIELCRASGGRFDPGIGRLVTLWGFDDEENYRSAPPAQSEIAATLLAQSSLCTARLDGDELSLETPGNRLDFGASAKGRAVQAAIEGLRQAGVEAGIVNAGGDLQVVGSPAGRRWRIGIRHPRPQPGREVLAALQLEPGEAVFTSGDYERYFIHDGQRYHHIIDPATGWPARSTISATVVHADPMLADAASTALFVAGADAADAVMRDMGIQLYLLLDADGARHVSPALEQRIEWMDDPR